MSGLSSYEDNFDYGPKVINPKTDSSESTPGYSHETNEVTNQSADQINRGQMGIMDEDNNEGNVGSPILGSSKPKWFSFYAAVGDDDNPGYETDPEHDVAGRDTDDVEEDADSDYGGTNKRKNLNDSTAATLVAMGGIGAIPEGFHNNDDIHYGDESFSHEQSKTPSQTGISGENSKDFDPFDERWNS